MTNISKFIRGHILLCAFPLSVMALGYLGYHAVRWIINKCHKTEKVDRVAHQTIGSASSQKASPSNNQTPNPHILPFSQAAGSRQSQEVQVDEVALRQQDESRKKTLAATTIQRAYRGHVARVALQKLKMDGLERQKPPGALDTSQRDTSPHQKVEVENVLKRLAETFGKHGAELCFPDGRREPVNIHEINDVESLLAKVKGNVNSNHVAMELSFEPSTSDAEVAATMKSFQELPASRALEFRISDYPKRTIIIQPKLTRSESLGGGRMRQIYANGITEEFVISGGGYEGTRIFPGGRKEKGEFHKESGELISGYRIEIDGKIEFIRPKSFASYQEASKNFEICDVEGKLVVLEKTFNKDHRIKYAITAERTVEEILLKANQRPPYGDGKSIRDVLSHESFKESRRSFIEHVLAADESGTPRVFGLSNLAALDVLEIGSQCTDLDPLNIIDPISGRNFITHAAYRGSAKLLNKIIELFPKEFLSIGQSVVAEILTQSHSKNLVLSVAEQLRKLGGKLDTYHSLWVQVAQGVKPDETFREQFSLLSIDQQQKLYDSAFAYNNPFIYEPSDLRVPADQYSINLMWINKDKMPADQEFLFGDGTTSEERKSDFHKRFISPVSKWARKNPGSPINIWVDSKMATEEAIERSKIALEAALKGTSHGIIQFRDVRSMDVVGSNPDAFSEKVPVYFRVDLLRAIAADYTLKNKETKYFVYGDIDMEPLSGRELFDKRTVNSLNEFGFVMAKGGHLGFENGFQILNGDNAQLMDSHRKVIIDLSVEMTLERPNAIQEQQIYDTYPAMITHFLDANGRYGKLNLSGEMEGVEDPSVTLGRFRYDSFKNSARHTLPLGEGKAKLREIMPRKPVSLPPSRFGAVPSRS